MNHNKIALVVLMAFANSAGAEEFIKLPSVVVTAQPIIEEVNVDAYSSTAAVVTESQLRDQNAVDLASALRRTPGMQIHAITPLEHSVVIKAVLFIFAVWVLAAQGVK